MMRRPTVIGIGEVLWDVYPDGPRFGGAPANFACHAAGLAGDDIDVFVASGVGQDQPGRRAIEELAIRRVHTDLVARVDRPTGQVFVNLDSQGQTVYEFTENTAWDNMTWSEELEQPAARADVVCFGTLAQRSQISRQTIQRIVQATPPGCVRLLDINLRPPFCDKQVVLQSLELANVLKLNDVELLLLARMLDWRGTESELLARLFNTFPLRLLALTRGAAGAMLLDSSGNKSDLPAQPVEVVDTVGAGDAFCAALAIGLLRGLLLATINAWATRVAGFVCTQPGAAPCLPDDLHHQ
jgi:fructokinase